MSQAPAIWLQTGTGRAFDLMQPTAAMVDFDIDIAEALARIPRFTGHVRSGSYSVAQHSVMGADALWRETGRSDIAAAFLLHDAHEAYLGDIATPVAHAIVETFRRNSTTGGFGADALARSLRLMKHVIDEAVHEAAGLPMPRADVAEAVKVMDLRMLATERRHLLGPSPHRWHASIEASKPVRLVGKFRVWPWPEAADEFRARLTAYLPARSKPAARRAPARHPEPLEA